MKASRSLYLQFYNALFVIKSLLKKYQPLLIISFFFWWYLSGLENLPHNFDEGIYLAKGNLMHQDQKPFRDFFFQQPPLYLYALQFFDLTPQKIFFFRLLSLVFACLSGILVYRVSSYLAGRLAGAISLALFMSSALQLHSLRAMPGSLMLFLALLSIAVLIRRRKVTAGITIFSGLCLAFSAQVKPLTIFWIIFPLLFFTFFMRNPRLLIFYLLSFALTSLLVTVFFIYDSEGGYLELLLIQAKRYTSKGGFANMQEIPAFKAMLDAKNISTAFAWNLNEHREVFFANPLSNGNSWLLLLVFFALFKLRARKTLRLLISTIVFIAISCLFVWEPVWDHYFIQYLPFMAISTSIIFRDSFWRKVLLIPVILISLNGLVNQRISMIPEKNVIHTGIKGKPVLSFDPYINIVNEAAFACDLIDPLSSYGKRNSDFFNTSRFFSRYHTSESDLLSCLKKNPATIYYIGQWFFWFLDEEILGHLSRVPSDLLIFQSEIDRQEYLKLKKF